MQEKYEIIGDLRGLNTMMAIEFAKNRRAKKPAEEVKRILNIPRSKGLFVLG